MSKARKHAETVAEAVLRILRVSPGEADAGAVSTTINMASPQPLLPPLEYWFILAKEKMIF